MEQKCIYLEARNQTLTDKLIWSQRSFIEKTFMNNSRVYVRDAFEAWKGIMGVLRFEHQMEVQTKSIKQCQQVSRELGAALAREQEVTRKHFQACQQMEADMESEFAAHVQLNRDSEKQSAELSLLQRQMQLIMKSRGWQQDHAQNILESLAESKSLCR